MKFFTCKKCGIISYPSKCEDCLIRYYGNLYSNAQKKIIERKRKGGVNGEK